MTDNIQNTINPAEIIKAMSDVSVLVVGDIILDKFIYGAVHRISPESPIPVLSVTREDIMLGGAANALASLVGLGVEGKLLSIVGDDDHGQKLVAKLSDIGVSDDGVVVDSSRPTTVKSRFLAEHQQLLRSDFEKTEIVSADIIAQLLAKAETVIKQVQAVVISDYGKGLLTSTFISALIELARKYDVPVIVDPKGQDYSIYRGANVVTPNKKELSEATMGAAVESDSDIIEAANILIESSGIETVVATRSGDGITVVQGHSEPVHLRTVDIEVFDVSGAGDVVIATIAAAMAAGASLSNAAALANIAGGIAVSKVGTTPIRAQELLDAFISDTVDLQMHMARGADAEMPKTTRTLQSGVYGWNEAQEQVKRWQARGLKVGLTNGCFDILHFGHVNYLNAARKKCDRLIVAMNQDSSVRLLKGDTRPIHDEESRASVLGALGSVDMVVLFGAQKAGDDNTANALIAKLKPDFYFKGGDYSIDQIPEASGVLRYGGHVEVMPEYAGHSTTASIQKMTA